MKSYNAHKHAIVQQSVNNCTNWIGHVTEESESLMAGQTFTSPAACPLEAIEIFPSLIAKPGKIILTVHHYDPDKKSWGPALSTSSLQVNCNESGQWLSFEMDGIQLQQGKTYGFRIESPDAYIGLGEAVGNYQHPPYDKGQEWKFTKKQDSEGCCFSYFSLAFKVDTKAA